MPPLQLLIKPASGMCNLRCRYCFYYDVTQNREQESYGLMSRETLENLVRKSLEYGEKSCGFAFQGGEPTLAGLDFYRELVEFVEKYNKKNLPISYSIQTNGYGLGEEWAEFFARNQFLVGISLDGVKATHDSQRLTPRGEGSFAGVMKTIELFNKNKVEYNILTVVNAKTAAKIRRIYEFYKKNNFHYQQYIACLDPLTEEPGSRDYSLTPEAYGQFLIDLFDLWYLDLQQGTQPYIRQFENAVGILAGYAPESCEQRGVCSVQHVVEADGSVYPCDFYVLDPFRLGNLNEDSFEEIDQSPAGEAFVKASLDRTEKCRACPYFYVCRGGCRRHRALGDGAVMGDNYFCKSYQMFYDAVLPRMEQIGAMLRRR